MLLLADIAPLPEQLSDDARRAAHSEQLLVWGIGLSAWFFLTGVASVAGVALVLRHAIDPPSPLTKKLAMWTAASNGVLALVSVALAFVLKGSPPFAGFSLDVAASAWIIAAVQVLLAIATLVLATARPVVVPDDDAPRAD